MMDDDKQQQKQERNLETVRKWYHNHSEEYNEARREKYAADKEARDKARERARKYRDRRRKGGGVTTDPLYRYVNGKGSCEYGQGERVPVWSTGQIAADIGCTPQMLRNWERKGWIPDSIFPDKHRLYTQHQYELVVKLAQFMEKYRTSPKKMKPELDLLIDHIHGQWMNYHGIKD
jgi:hypothetical protein